VPKIDDEHHWLRAASSRVGHLFPGLLSQPACNRRLLWWATNVGAGGGAGRAEQAQADQSEGPLGKDGLLVGQVGGEVEDEAGHPGADRHGDPDGMQGVPVGAAQPAHRVLGCPGNPDEGPGRTLTAASELLEQYGYEPQRSRQHPAAAQLPIPHPGRRAPEIVCAINQALLDGLLRGLGDQRVQAVLPPPTQHLLRRAAPPGPPR
jgi:hypothetical protein